MWLWHTKHPWCRRHRQRFWPIQIAMLAWATFGMVFVHRLDASFWWHLGILLVLMSLVAPLAFNWHSMTRLVKREKGRACGNCLFPLKGLPMQGDCPECGRGYSIKHTIACWKHDLGLKGMYEYRHWPELPEDS